MASTLIFLGLTQVAASVFQMMRGLIIVFTAKVAIIMFGRSLYRHHVVAITFIVTGIFVVGSTQFNSGELESEGKKSPLVGFLLIAIGQIF